MCRSGSAGDTQAVAAYVQRFLAQHEIEQGASTPVPVAASIVRQMIYANKGMLSAGLIVGGWDEHNGPQIHAIPMGGTLVKVWSCCVFRAGLLHILWVLCGHAYLHICIYICSVWAYNANECVEGSVIRASHRCVEEWEPSCSGAICDWRLWFSIHHRIF